MAKMMPIMKNLMEEGSKLTVKNALDEASKVSGFMDTTPKTPRELVPTPPIFGRPPSAGSVTQQSNVLSWKKKLFHSRRTRMKTRITEVPVLKYQDAFTLETPRLFHEQENKLSLIKYANEVDEKKNTYIERLSKDEDGNDENEKPKVSYDPEDNYIWKLDNLLLKKFGRARFTKYDKELMKELNCHEMINIITPRKVGKCDLLRLVERNVERMPTPRRPATSAADARDRLQYDDKFAAEGEVQLRWWHHWNEYDKLGIHRSYTSEKKTIGSPWIPERPATVGVSEMRTPSINERCYYNGIRKSHFNRQVKQNNYGEVDEDELDEDDKRNRTDNRIRLYQEGNYVPTEKKSLHHTFREQFLIPSRMCNLWGLGKTVVDWNNWYVGDSVLIATCLHAGITSFILVEHINLNGNNLTRHSLKEVVTIVNPQMIKHLHLSNNRLDKNAMNLLTKYLLSSSGGCTVLLTLDISSNNIGDDGINILCEGILQCPNLENCGLSNIGIGHRASTGKILGHLLASHISLKSLDISHNALHGLGAYDFFQGVLENDSKGSLHYLWMAWNALGRENITKIIQLFSTIIRTCTTLFHVDLSYNDLRAIDLEILALALSENNTLWGLHMDGNQASIDYDGSLLPFTTEIKGEEYHYGSRSYLLRPVQETLHLAFEKRKKMIKVKSSAPKKNKDEEPQKEGKKGGKKDGKKGGKKGGTEKEKGTKKANKKEAQAKQEPRRRRKQIQVWNSGIPYPANWINYRIALQPWDFCGSRSQKKKDKFNNIGDSDSSADEGKFDAGDFRTGTRLNDILHDGRNPVTRTSICWLCDQWSEQRVIWKPGVSGNAADHNITSAFVFFSIDNYLNAIKLLRKESAYGVVTYEGYRALPPESISKTSVIYQINNEMVCSEALPCHNSIKYDTQERNPIQLVGENKMKKVKVVNLFSHQQKGNFIGSRRNAIHCCKIEHIEHTMGIERSEWNKKKKIYQPQQKTLKQLNPSDRLKIHILPRNIEKIEVGEDHKNQFDKIRSSNEKWCIEYSMFSLFRNEDHEYCERCYDTDSRYISKKLEYFIPSVTFENTLQILKKYIYSFIILYTRYEYDDTLEPGLSLTNFINIIERIGIFSKLEYGELEKNYRRCQVISTDLLSRPQFIEAYFYCLHKNWYINNIPVGKYKTLEHEKAAWSQIDDEFQISMNKGEYYITRIIREVEECRSNIIQEDREQIYKLYISDCRTIFDSLIKNSKNKLLSFQYWNQFLEELEILNKENRNDILNSFGLSLGVRNREIGNGTQIPESGQTFCEFLIGLGIALQQFYTKKELERDGLSHLLDDFLMSYIKPYAQKIIFRKHKELTTTVRGFDVSSEIIRDLFLFLRVAFKRIDADGNEELDDIEFKKAFQSKEIKTRLESFGIQYVDASHIFEMVDLDGSGTIC